MTEVSATTERGFRAYSGTTFDAAEWARCAPWIEAAVSRGQTHSVEDVKEEVLAGRMWLWTGRRCAMITELIDYPRLRAVRVFCGGGELNASLQELLEMEQHVATWGKALGCSRIEGFGREGWDRILRKLGYEGQRTFMWAGL